MEGRTHRPELDPARCGVCGVCAGACPATFSLDLADEEETLRGTLAALSAERRELALPACRQACPLGQDIQGYIGRLAAGDQAGALDIILRDNPLPSVLGHICHHPCQKACIDPATGGGPRIRDLKRFAALAPRPAVTPLADPKARVAIVGSGPAGLAAAWHLAKSGVAATIYEAQPVAGGMLAWAIPEFRLPRAALKTDLDYVLAHGVELKLNTLVTAESLAGLRDEYDAVLLACGAPRAKGSGLSGADLPGVWLGLDFLKKAALGPAPRIAGPVVVIGGGNVALDAARWCLRQKAAVTLAYRRDREQMPAYKEEIAAAEKEGLKLSFRLQPTAIKADGGGLIVQCQKTEPTTQGADGRLSYAPRPGSEQTLQAGTVILALGQDTEAAAWAKALGLDGIETDGSGRLAPGLYAAGDLVSGPATVVEAMAAGIGCAQGIIEEKAS